MALNRLKASKGVREHKPLLAAGLSEVLAESFARPC